MLSHNQKIPLGKLLQNAGLISPQQLQRALSIQSEYSQIKLGEILVLQEAIKSKTIDFFVYKWEEIQQEGQQFHLGYYLQDAYLLSDEQVEVILDEQKNKRQKFGAIAIDKGWLNKNTIDFFINNLELKIPRLLSLDDLKAYDQENSNLESKYTNYNLILTRILGWTGGNFTLVKIIYHALANVDFKINTGEEILAVDKLVNDNLIKHWQTAESGKYLRFIQYKILHHKNCSPYNLLKEYQEILLSGSKKYQHTKIQNELLVLGLVIEHNNFLKVTNLIYQQIFNQDWLTVQIAKLKLANQAKKSLVSQTSGDRLKTNKLELKRAIAKSQLLNASKSKQQEVSNIYLNFNKPKLEEHVPYEPLKLDATLETIIPQTSTLNGVSRSQNRTLTVAEQENSQLNSNTLEPITKLGSSITLVGIILFIPLVLAINHYYSSSPSSIDLGYQPLSDREKLQRFCQDLDLINPKTSLHLISKLETSQQELMNRSPDDVQAFPHNCKVALNKLRVLSVPQLEKDNRVIEAIQNLCKVPADSDSLNGAKIWIDQWYDSPDWSKTVRPYLRLNSQCPANDR